MHGNWFWLVSVNRFKCPGCQKKCIQPNWVWVCRIRYRDIERCWVRTRENVGGKKTKKNLSAKTNSAQIDLVAINGLIEMVVFTVGALIQQHPMPMPPVANEATQ